MVNTKRVSPTSLLEGMEHRHCNRAILKPEWVFGSNSGETGGLARTIR